MPTPRRRARPVKNVVIVTRVSTQLQADNTSHGVQREACERFAHRQGWNVVAVLEETESGMLYIMRYETQAAIAMVEAGTADAVVFYDFTRFGRDSENQHKILNRIIAAGGQLQISTFPLVYGLNGRLTPEHLRMFILLAGDSPVEKELITRRMMGGKQAATDAGRMVARTWNPYGWIIATKTLVTKETYPKSKEGYYFPVPEKLAFVRQEIFEAFSQGESLNAIARRLTLSGTPSPGGKTVWYPYSISYILKNPLYCGRPAWARTASYKDETRPADGLRERVVERREYSEWQFLDTPDLRTHFQSPEIAPHLIPEEMWWKCAELLATNRRTRSGAPAHRYMLSGIAICPECGASMKGRVQTQRKTKAGLHQKDAPTYLCRMHPSHNRTYGRRECRSPRWQAARLEQLVLAGLEWFLAKPEIVGQAEKLWETELRKRQNVLILPDANERRKTRVAEIQTLEVATIDSKIEAKVKGHDLSAYDAVLTRLAGEKRTLQLQLAQAEIEEPTPLPQQVSEIRDAIKVVLDDLRDPEVPNAEKNQWLTQLVQQIILEHWTPGLKRRTVDLQGIKIILVSEPGAKLTIKVSQRARSLGFEAQMSHELS